MKILLTDDAPTILKVVGRLLRSNGHSVETAVNGHQSLEKLKTYYTNNECDVLLTDLQMPVMDGIECTKRFRVWEETQQCLLDAQGMTPPPRLSTPSITLIIYPHRLLPTPSHISTPLHSPSLTHLTYLPPPQTHLQGNLVVLVFSLWACLPTVTLRADKKCWKQVM